MDRPSKETLARMPLAEAVLLLWRWVTCKERMQNLWNLHRGRCYQKIISFERIKGSGAYKGRLGEDWGQGRLGSGLDF